MVEHVEHAVLKYSSLYIKLQSGQLEAQNMSQRQSSKPPRQIENAPSFSIKLKQKHLVFGGFLPDTSSKALWSFGWEHTFFFCILFVDLDLEI